MEYKDIDMQANYQKVLDFIKETKIFISQDTVYDNTEISDIESANVCKLFNKGIITEENIFDELGLTIFHEYGHYGIVDVRKWMLAKIKYGI